MPESRQPTPSLLTVNSNLPRKNSTGSFNTTSVEPLSGEGWHQR
jgi:hypothetical protein